MLFGLLLAATAFAYVADNDTAPQYIVGLYDSASVTAAQLLSQSAGLETITVTAKTGQKFLCVLPSTATEEVELVESNGKQEVHVEDGVQKEEELKPVEERFGVQWNYAAGEIRKKFKELCFERLEGYWTYSVCPFKSISQYHGEQKSPFFGLGRYNAKESESLSLELSREQWLNKEDEEKLRPFVFAQKFEDGTGGRTTVVEYRCQYGIGKNTEIESISEIQPLNYEMIVVSPFLCKDAVGQLESMGTVISQIGDKDPLFSALSLLKVFENQCLLYQAGWWTYKLCHLNRISQFHVDQVAKQKNGDSGAQKPQFEQVVTAEFFLGTWLLNGHWSKFNPKDTRITSVLSLHNASSPQDSFVSVHYSQGTKCDLTGEFRATEVRFRCNEDVKGGKIISIAETSTCQYLVIVETNTLCNHPAFKAPVPETFRIRCAPIVDESDQSISADEVISEEIEETADNFGENTEKAIIKDEL